jgi:hypothetical protein
MKPIRAGMGNHVAVLPAPGLWTLPPGPDAWGWCVVLRVHAYWLRGKGEYRRTLNPWLHAYAPLRGSRQVNL